MNPKKLILWCIWGAILTFVLIAPNILSSGESSEGAPLELFHLALLVGPLTLATFIRWIVLPRAKTLAAVTPLFIAGLAISESLIFLGLFVAADHESIFIAAALVGIFQFIPLGIKDPAEKTEQVFQLSE